jgi:glycosyltransferase involved in cell wall biosynthesis
LNNDDSGKGNISYSGKLSFEETADLFSRASIFVLPAKYEPFGLTPLEAALSGCALVLGKTASLLEIWEDAALFVTPGDVEELVFIVNYLIEHRDLIKTNAVRAHKRGVQLSSVKMGQEYLSLYRRIIKNITQKHKAVV